MKVTIPMPSMLITCPESAHLESIEYEDEDLGMLITSCTVFSPPCAVTCARLCAARLDKRRKKPDHAHAEPIENTTLVSIRI